MTGNGMRHFLDLIDVSKSVLAGMIDNSRAMKAARARGIVAAPLAGKTLAMIFDKPSTRTRVSFDVAMRQLGGEAILLTAQEMQLGRGARRLLMFRARPSTRARVSFDVAMRQLGGEAILLTAQEMQLGRGETLADTARVLSRYVDAIMIRILDHEAVAEL